MWMLSSLLCHVTSPCSLFCDLYLHFIFLVASFSLLEVWFTLFCAVLWCRPPLKLSFLLRDLWWVFRAAGPCPDWLWAEVEVHPGQGLTQDADLNTSSFWKQFQCHRQISAVGMKSWRALVVCGERWCNLSRRYLEAVFAISCHDD